MFLRKAEQALIMDIVAHVWVNGRRGTPNMRRLSVAGIDLDLYAHEGVPAFRCMIADGWSATRAKDGQWHRAGDYARMTRELTMIKMADVLPSNANQSRL